MPSADSQDYLWIAVGDIHDEPERFAQIPELSQADGIIVTGDLTITGGVKQAETFMDALRVHDVPVLAGLVAVVAVVIAAAGREVDAARAVMQAIEQVTANPALHTRDLGGTATTAQVTDAVCALIGSAPLQKAA